MPREDEPDPVLLRSARTADALHAVAFRFVAAVVLISPWCFASREMWWFWPMAALLWLGCLFCGSATLVESAFLHGPDSPVRRRRIPARAFAALALCAPFLLYALARAQFPSAPGGFPLVEMEARRSLLCHATPFALALVLVLSSRRRGRAVLLRLFLLDTFLLAAYGVWNHVATGDLNVLWVVPNEFYNFTYPSRIGSSFYCPNHFSGWLDTAICVLLGGALAPGGRPRDRWLCALGAAALVPVDLLTLSRGGVGALAVALRGRRPLWRALGTLGVVGAAALGAAALRYASWPREAPLADLSSVSFGPGGRAAETAAGPKTLLSYADGAFRVRGEGASRVETVPAADLLPVRLLPLPADAGEAGRFAAQVRRASSSRTDFAEPAGFDADGTLRYRAYNPFMNRVKGHPLWRLWERGGSGAELRERVVDAFWHSFDRGQYIGAALRVWRSNPVWGVGPGQNQHRWAQFAATPDGVRAEPGRPETLKKPRLLNAHYHLYEVHSDWVQLLEEYGLVGFALFGVGFVGLAVLLVLRQPETARGSAPALDRGLPLGGLLAGGAIAVQSVFDFSLQMPCLDWLFGFLVASAILSSRHDRP